MKTHSDRKSGLHPRNRHQAPYDFDALCQRTPELQPFVFVNEHGTQSLDFADPAAVKALNKALLALHYGIAHWDLPAGYLCPPIPGGWTTCIGWPTCWPRVPARCRRQGRPGAGYRGRC